jgi:hypothetical protein
VNRLLKNVAGQLIPFLAMNSAGAPITGLVGSFTGITDKDNAGQNVVAGVITEVGNGVYYYAPTQDETNGDVVYFSFNDTSAGMMTVLEAFRTESPSGDSVLAAVQPHYAPAKPGDAMALLANQDVRTILGNVVGNLEGNVLGTVPSPATLNNAAVDAILDRTDGISSGLTVRAGLRELIAALVNVSVAFALSAHTGPTTPGLKPKYPPSARKLLGLSSADLQRLLAFAVANPGLGLLAPNLATACQQLSTALDAVRTSSA